MSQSAFQRFINELRRRHVPQTAAVYLVAAWAAIEFSDVVVPNLSGPQWVVTAVIVAAGVGFPVVLVLAWMFDWGPGGVVRTPDEDRPGTGSPTGGPGSTPWLAAIAVLVVGIGSALAVAALLAGDEEAAGPTAEGAAGEDEGSRAEPSRPDRPALLPYDSIDREVTRALEEVGLADLERFEALRSLGSLGEGLGDSLSREQVRSLARSIAGETDRGIFIREPPRWRLGMEVPVTIAEGDTLTVEGIAQDSAGVVAVTVDGQVAVETEDPQPLLAFRAQLVGRPVNGLRDIPIVLRTADGREIRTVYSVATPPERR